MDVALEASFCIYLGAMCVISTVRNFDYIRVSVKVAVKTLPRYPCSESLCVNSTVRNSDVYRVSVKVAVKTLPRFPCCQLCTNEYLLE